jgi:hypothetical protein
MIILDRFVNNRLANHFLLDHGLKNWLAETLNFCWRMSSISLHEAAQIVLHIFMLYLWYHGKKHLWAQPPDCVIRQPPNNRTLIATRLAWIRMKLFNPSLPLPAFKSSNAGYNGDGVLHHLRAVMGLISKPNLKSDTPWQWPEPLVHNYKQVILDASEGASVIAQWDHSTAGYHSHCSCNLSWLCSLLVQGAVDLTLKWEVVLTSVSGWNGMTPRYMACKELFSVCLLNSGPCIVCNYPYLFKNWLQQEKPILAVSLDYKQMRSNWTEVPILQALCGAIAIIPRLFSACLKKSNCCRMANYLLHVLILGVAIFQKRIENGHTCRSWWGNDILFINLECAPNC